jgi:hypothetical protein
MTVQSALMPHLFARVKVAYDAGERIVQLYGKPGDLGRVFPRNSKFIKLRCELGRTLVDLSLPTAMKNTPKPSYNDLPLLAKL